MRTMPNVYLGLIRCYLIYTLGDSYTLKCHLSVSILQDRILRPRKVKCLRSKC
jgi:hypothetical protein